MKITNFLSKKSIALNVHPTDKNDAIAMLVDLLMTAGTQTVWRLRTRKTIPSRSRQSPLSPCPKASNSIHSTENLRGC